MELKTYQLGALDAFSRWLESLKEAQSESEVAIEALEREGVNIPNEHRNYPKTAWQKLRRTAGLPKVRANTLTAPTMQIDRFRISASKCRQVGAKPCSPPPLWNVSIGKPG